MQFRNTKLLKERQVTLIKKKVLILLKILMSQGHLNMHVREESQCQQLLHPFYWRKQDVEYHLTFIPQILL